MICINCKTPIDINNFINEEYGWYLSEKDILAIVEVAGYRKLRDVVFNEIEEHATRVCLCRDCRDKKNKPWNDEKFIIDFAANVGNDSKSTN